MKKYKIILLIFFIFAFVSSYAEKQNGDTNIANQRTPEQEAIKQTEKLQSELNLTREQVNTLYQINLKYAQARQKGINRKDAMRMIKNKEEDIQRVLSADQNEQLKSKRLTRQPIDVGGNTEYTRTNPQLRSSYSNRDESRRTTTTRTTQSSRRDANSTRDVRSTNNNANRQSSSNQTSTRSATTRSSSSSAPARNTNSRSSSTDSGSRR